MENPMNKWDDLGGFPPIFGSTPKWSGYLFGVLFCFFFRSWWRPLQDFANVHSNCFLLAVYNAAQPMHDSELWTPQKQDYSMMVLFKILIYIKKQVCMIRSQLFDKPSESLQ